VDGTNIHWIQIDLSGYCTYCPIVSPLNSIGNCCLPLLLFPFALFPLILFSSCLVSIRLHCRLLYAKCGLISLNNRWLSMNCTAGTLTLQEHANTVADAGTTRYMLSIAILWGCYYYDHIETSRTKMLNEKF
jgi:hypothetical protein